MKKVIKTVAWLVCFTMVIVLLAPFNTATVKANSKVSIKKSGGWLESAYVEWHPAKDAKNYKVYVKKSGGSYSSAIDDELIRRYKASDGSFYYRADIVGLSAGNYTIKVVPVIGGSESSSNGTETGSVTVTAHDRTGFAWVGGSANGAYNANGTLKSNAVVVYVSEATKNSVSLNVVTSSSGKTTAATGLQNILAMYKKGYDKRPLCIRILGKVTDPSTLSKGDLEVSGSGDAANKRLSCGLTIEGIGEDAVAYGWGIRIKNSSNVEIRNLAVMLCDSSEGDNISLQQGDDHVWVHNCDLFYGMPGSDADQVKGDGALDCKKSTYVTFSYNHFWDSGKCNLQGGSTSDTSNYITYHHNWYDHSDSRHPRIRVASVHVYNNYYDGNSKYGVGATTGASVFVESNYFRNCKYPMLISMQGHDSGTFSGEQGGIIKSYNNKIIGGSGYTTYSQNSTSFDAYEVTSAKQTVPSSVVTKLGSKTYNNFDTSSTMYSYTAQTPDAAKTSVMKYAGRVNGGDFDYTFSSSADTSYSVDSALMTKIKSYSSSMVAVGSADDGKGSSNTSSGGSSTTGGSDSTGESSGGSSDSETNSGGSSDNETSAGDNTGNDIVENNTNKSDETESKTDNDNKETTNGESLSESKAENSSESKVESSNEGAGQPSDGSLHESSGNSSDNDNNGDSTSETVAGNDTNNDNNDVEKKSDNGWIWIVVVVVVVVCAGGVATVLYMKKSKEQKNN